MQDLHRLRRRRAAFVVWRSFAWVVLIVGETLVTYASIPDAIQAYEALREEDGAADPSASAASLVPGLLTGPFRMRQAELLRRRVYRSEALAVSVAGTAFFDDRGLAWIPSKAARRRGARDLMIVSGEIVALDALRWSLRRSLLRVSTRDGHAIHLVVATKSLPTLCCMRNGATSIKVEGDEHAC